MAAGHAGGVGAPRRRCAAALRARVSQRGGRRAVTGGLHAKTMAPGMSRAAKPASASERVLYFYGVTAAAAKPPRGALGVDGESALEPLPCGDLLCWVSRVPRRDYADELAANMESLEWLAAAGVRHQRAVSAIAALGDVLPTRFGTVFMTEASLCADIAARRAELHAALKRIRGCDEWGVKVF